MENKELDYVLGELRKVLNLKFGIAINEEFETKIKKESFDYLHHKIIELMIAYFEKLSDQEDVTINLIAASTMLAASSRCLDEIFSGMLDKLAIDFEKENFLN